MSNVVNLKVPDEVNILMDRFEVAGKQIYIVGGIVRDLLLGRPLLDWDMTTDATPEEILAINPESFYDNKYGTVGVKPEDGSRPFEITTFRTEGAYTDNRRPD